MKRSLTIACGLAITASAASATVFPPLPHAAFNFIPFGGGVVGGVPTMHQVFDSALFSTATGGLPAEITAIGFAVNTTSAGQTVDLGKVVIYLGYTTTAPSTLLGIPTQGGGGAPNATGAMTEFYANAATTFAIATGGAEVFTEMVFTGTPFVYDPQLGNLLVEIVVPSEANLTLSVSRAAGSASSTRAYSGMRFAAGAANNASRMDFTFTAVTGCDPDLTTGAIAGQPGYGVPNGILNNDDFFYYLSQFAAGNLAVADLTTTAIPGSPGYGIPNGVLNNDDFFFYLSIFAAGC